MADRDRYVALIASLPSSEKLFLAKQPPLSRLRLERRLRALTPEDASTLELVESALDWRGLSMASTDAEVIARGRKALSCLESATLRTIVGERLEIRTAMSALRRRARGEGAPSADTRWGFGRWVDHIRRNWTEPTFRLDGALPWIREANRLLGEDDPVSLERLILQHWNRLLSRHAGDHLFDLEAVVIYVLKWNIFDRWARANAVAAKRRFEELTEAGLGTYQSLSFEGVL